MRPACRLGSSHPFTGDAPGRQARTADAIRVEPRTQLLGEPVEATRFQQYVQFFSRSAS
jgi:hypothetical protein